MYGFAKMPVEKLMVRYKMSKTTILHMELEAEVGIINHVVGHFHIIAIVIQVNPDIRTLSFSDMLDEIVANIVGPAHDAPKIDAAAIGQLLHEVVDMVVLDAISLGGNEGLDGGRSIRRLETR